MSWGQSKFGKSLKPFGGKLKYDYLLWIDSDIIFNINHVGKLINRNLDIVSGLYSTENVNTYATVVDWDIETYKKNGRFDFLEKRKVKGTLPFEVSYTGFGFILVQYGVFEALEFPWFKPRYIDISENISEFAMEDVSFCLDIVDKGYKIYVDPTVIVGHEKTYIV